MPYTYFRVVETYQKKENNKNYTAIDLQVEGWAFNITGVWECQEDKGEYFIS